MARDPKELEKLAEALASLTNDERKRVLSELDRRMTHRPHAPWQNLQALKGRISLGGDAVKDCDGLYDG